MVSVGTIVWLSSELMFFAALFAMYFSIRAADYSQWETHTEVLNLPYATTFTLILVASSVTCQFGVLAAEKGDVHSLRRWFTITLHVTGGLVAFLIFMARTTMGRFTPAQATSAIVVSYYWHFVDIVWIALFSMIYLLQ
jgi:cytochrome c oxidase subunit 3